MLRQNVMFFGTCLVLLLFVIVFVIVSTSMVENSTFTLSFFFSTRDPVLCK